MTDVDLEAAWTVLETEAATAGITTVPADVAIQSGTVLIGVDGQGRRHLLVPLRPGEAAEDDRQGQSVHLVRVKQGGITYLSAVCMREELQPVFGQFVRELLSDISKANSPARAVVLALGRWRQLFQPAASPALGEAQQVGLLAELLVLDDLMASGAAASLDFWTGPAGAQHDFRTALHAFEVKGTLVREGRVVQIHGVEQLDAESGVALHLMHLRFDRDPVGQTLPGAIQSVLARGADAKALNDRLQKVGYRDAHKDIYGEHRYRLIERRTYDVRDTYFPRIIRDSFVRGVLPPGTLRFAYSIDLTNEPPTALTAEETQRVLTSMAKEHAP